MASTANSEQIIFENVTGLGRYWTDWYGDRVEGGDLGILTDGYIPPQGSPWWQDTVGFGPAFTNAVYPGEIYETVFFIFDIGSLYFVENILVAVDNNDDYHVAYSADGSNWSPLFTISRDYGTVDEFNPGGTDIFTTLPEHQNFEPLISFFPVTARYLVIYATGHDWGYNISEFQAFGTPVPGPADVLQVAITEINELPPSSLKNGNMTNAFNNKINKVLDMIDEGLYENAIKKLKNDILKKTNGCATSGAPDRNDWIKDCEAQEDIYNLIMETIEMLEDMI